MQQPNNNNPADRQPPQNPGQRVQLRLDDTGLQAHYSNLTRVTAGPEEVIIDFGMSMPNADEPQNQSARMTDRVILNYFNTKRLAMTLNATVARYEKAFGPIELDASKRQLHDEG